MCNSSLGRQGRKIIGKLTKHEQIIVSTIVRRYKLIVQLSQHQHMDVEKQGALGPEYLHKARKERQRSSKISRGKVRSFALKKALCLNPPEERVYMQ